VATDLTIHIDDRAGELARITSLLGAYLATNTRLVFAADDLGAAKAALG
jgi:hypothetical protein